MKTAALLAVVCVTASVAVAAPRSREQMRRIAEEALGTERVRDGRLRAPGQQRVGVVAERSHLVVYGSASGQIVVVPTDDAYPDVIGMAGVDAADDEDAPWRWWLETVNGNMRRGMVRRAPAGVPVVKPMLETAWGQMDPFNTRCPEKLSGGELKRCKVGCVALAMGQIMRYYGHPARGTGEKTYGLLTKLHARFGETRYDWHNMPPTQEEVRTPEQEEAVGTLLYHCGVAVGMMYGVSTSYILRNAVIPTALTTYFGYDKTSIGYVERSDYDENRWMGMIYAELQAGRPILYTGSSETLGGHAFVIDGCNADGLVHVNWGWYGSGDGYFDMALTGPGTDFRHHQAMIIGIRPAAETTRIGVAAGACRDTSATRIYGLDGRRLTRRPRGLHVVRRADGRVEKRF